ncbi:MAG: hypothetical protein V7785_24795 [Bermanella sp.]
MAVELKNISASFETLESVNENLTLFLFDEEGLVYSVIDKKLHFLNSLGMYVWLLFEEGLSKREVLSTCIDNSIDQSGELDELVEELNTLFVHACLPAESHDEQELWLEKIPGANNSKTQGFYYKILDSKIVVTYCDLFSKKTIEPLLNVFIRSGQVFCDYMIEIKKAGEEYLICINGFDFSWKIPQQRLAAFFNDRIRKMVFTTSDYFMASHAAVLSKGDKCLMMPAVSYSGKSTLSAALLSADYQYFSDEMAVLDKEYQARPVPLGIGIKQGSWKALNSYLPQLKTLKEQERWDGVPLKYVPVSTSIRHGTARKKVSHLVFPTYTQGSAAKLLAISTPQAICQLFEAGFTMKCDFSRKQVIELLNWLESVPTYKFVFSQLDEAIESLEVL